MPIDYGIFYVGGDSAGFRESAEFLRDLDDDDIDSSNPDLNTILEEDHVYAESAEALNAEEAHLSQHLQNEFAINADDKDAEEVDEMERLRDHVERSGEQVRSVIENYHYDESNLENVQPQVNESFGSLENEGFTSDNDADPILSLKIQQMAMMKNNEQMLGRLFPEDTDDQRHDNGNVSISKEALKIANDLAYRLDHISQVSLKYLGGKQDLETPDIIYFSLSIKKFLEDISDQALLILDIFEEEAYRHLNLLGVLYTDRDIIVQLLLEVHTDLQDFLESMSNIAMELLKKLTDPRQNATINLALEMIDLETEGLRSQRFSEQQIEKRISQHIPFFLSEARLKLPYYTPLASLLSTADIKYLTRFDLKNLVKMAVRLEIPRSYFFNEGSVKTGKTYRKKINADPTTQLFVLLARMSHGITLKTLQIITKIDFRKLSAMQLALEHYLVQTKGQLLNCSRFRATPHYREFLSQNVPDTSTPECDLMEENVAFSIGSTVQKIAKPTNENFAGSKYTYCGKRKMHCLRYQVVCDLFRLIWDVAGPFGGSVDNKRLYHESNFSNRLENFVDHEHKPFVIYGSSDYNANDIVTFQLIAASKAKAGQPLTQIQKLKNQQYDQFRIIMGRTFGMIANLFKGLTLWSKNKINITDCANSYKLACFFLNCYTITYKTTNNKKLRECLDDKSRNGNTPINLADYLHYWIKDEHKATISEDGTMINDENEDLEMRSALQGISEKGRAYNQKAAQMKAATAVRSTTDNESQISNHESENRDELDN
ncbi:hypothetical protein ACO0OL_004056 [Hanseniaspora opuntiae]